MAQTPTPGPWRTDTYYETQSDKRQGIYSGELLIVDCGSLDAPLKDVIVANAELIVRAVNCHADLLAALKGLAADAAGFVALADPSVHGHTNIAVLNHWIDQARAALARAEGLT